MLAAHATPARAVASSSSPRLTVSPTRLILVTIAQSPRLECLDPWPPSHRCTGFASARHSVYGLPCSDVQGGPGLSRPLDGNVGLLAGGLRRLLHINFAESTLCEVPRTP